MYLSIGLILLLVSNNFRLQKNLNEQEAAFKRQAQVADSLTLILEKRRIEDEREFTRAKQILAKAEHDADSLRNAIKTTKK